jgi:hypothetical protein
VQATAPAPRAGPPTDTHAGDAAISVVSDPPDAEVRIDGERKGLTPLRTGGLRPGTVVVEVRKPGYTPFSKSLRVEAGSEYSVRTTLGAEGRDDGFISVTSDPPGAQVSLNGAPSGAAPLKIGPLHPGHYEVSALFPGFPREAQTIDMKAGELHKLNFIFHSGR